MVVAKEALLNAFLVTALLTFAPAALAQTPPSAYDGLHRAAYGGDVEGIRRLISQGADVNARDPHGRTPAHVAAFASQNEALRALAEVGADMNALEGQAYDVVTIAAVADDPGLMSLAIELGNDPSRVLVGCRRLRAVKDADHGNGERRFREAWPAKGPSRDRTPAGRGFAQRRDT